MKSIVIAYDGSEGSETILTELRHAGLPQQLNAHVVTVAKGWAVPDLAAKTPITALPSSVRSGKTGRGVALDEVKALADRGAECLREAFREWKVVSTGLVGSAAQVIVQRARDVSAGIIFVGSHSHSAPGSIFLGSVAQKVAAEAGCSVHVCRPGPSPGTESRVLVAVDGSRASEAAADAVAERPWPAGTKVAVVNVMEPPLRTGMDAIPPEAATEIRRQYTARLAWLESRGDAALRVIERSAVASEHHTLEGEPKSTLLGWAEHWNANCLFVGATGLNETGDDTLGTVASALSVRAHCSVEIVRP